MTERHAMRQSDLFLEIGPPEAPWKMWLQLAAMLVPPTAIVAFVTWMQWLDHICTTTGNC